MCFLFKDVAMFENDVQWTTIALCALSMAACACLMWLIGKPSGKPLLARQLWHMAVADFLCACGTLLLNAAQVFLRERGMLLGNVGRLVALSTFGTSAMLEPHIAAGFVAAYWRSSCLLTSLIRTVWLPWVAAVVFLLFPFFKQLSVQQGPIWIAGYMAISVFTTFVLYSFAAFRGLWYPARSAQRVDLMIWLYPLAYSVTSGPLFYSCVYVRGSPEVLLLPGACVALRGVCNVLIYACQSRVASWSELAPENCVFARWDGSLHLGFKIQESEISAREQSASSRGTWSVGESVISVMQ